MNKICVFLCFISIGYALPFTDCGSLYHLSNIQVEKCKYLPCPLFMSNYVNISVTMKATFHSSKLYQNITIITKKVKTPTVSNPQTCEGHRLCPIPEGDASFTTQLWVPDIVPFPSKLQWIITNEYEKTVMCFELDVLLCDYNINNEKCYQ